LLAFYRLHFECCEDNLRAGIIGLDVPQGEAVDIKDWGFSLARNICFVYDVVKFAIYLFGYCDEVSCRVLGENRLLYADL
jgi:hypothetical protein